MPKVISKGGFLQPFCLPKSFLEVTRGQFGLMRFRTASRLLQVIEACNGILRPITSVEITGGQSSLANLSHVLGIPKCWGAQKGMMKLAILTLHQPRFSLYTPEEFSTGDLGQVGGPLCCWSSGKGVYDGFRIWPTSCTDICFFVVVPLLPPSLHSTPSR